MAETRLRQSVDAAKVRVPLEEAYALSCQLRDPCWEAACARALAMTFSAEGNSSVALECLDVAHRSCLHETDPFVSLSVEILADKVEANKSLGRNDEAIALSREWVALAARAHMDVHVVRAPAFLPSTVRPHLYFCRHTAFHFPPFQLIRPFRSIGWLTAPNLLDRIPLEVFSEITFAHDRLRAAISIDKLQN
jgi:hypothetical protein